MQQCNECESKFFFKKTLKSHIKQKHNLKKKNYVCRCGERFNTIYGKRDHECKLPLETCNKSH